MTQPLELPPLDWIFFDLDGTLWDHLTASAQAIYAMSEELGVDSEMFVAYYRAITLEVIAEIEAGLYDIRTSRIVRFERILRAFDLDPSRYDIPELCTRFLDSYVNYSSVIAGAGQVIEAAAGIARLAILTNAAHDTQDPKVAQLPNAHLFEFVVTTDETHCLKPDPRFFEVAEQMAGSPNPERILMVGDSWENDVYAPHLRGYWATWISEEEEPPEPLERLWHFPRIGGMLPLLHDGLASAGRRG